jgi:hypothetical protein
MNADKRECGAGAAAMSGDRFLIEIRGDIVGRAITYRRLAANSLLLYVDSDPDDPTGYIIWFEPTWHVSSPKGVLIGSCQAQVETKEELSEAGKPLDQLVGHRIEWIVVDGNQ